MDKVLKQHMSIAWQEIAEDGEGVCAAEASLKDKASLVGRVGLLMLSVGTGAWRVRSSMNRVARALGITCNADIGLLTINYTCVEKGESYTNAFSIRTTGVNTDKLTLLEWFCNEFESHASRYSVSQFHNVLDTIEHKPGQYKAPHVALAAALACGAFTFLLGGGPIEILLAFFGAGVGMFVRKLLLEKRITLLANVALGVSAAGLTYMLLMIAAEELFGISDVYEAGYICSMLFVVPGFPLITGGFDLAKLDLRSGMERIMYALLIILMATMSGWAVASLFRFAPANFVPLEINTGLMIPLRMLCSFLGVYGFSFLFNSTRKVAFIAGIIGMIANTLRLELIDLGSMNIGLAAFCGALVAGVLASIIDHFLGYPRISLTVPSIVIMVPGMFMYKAVYFIANNDVVNGAAWCTKAILIVLSMQIGLIFARILTDVNFRKSS